MSVCCCAYVTVIVIMSVCVCLSLSRWSCPSVAVIMSVCVCLSLCGRVRLSLGLCLNDIVTVSPIVSVTIYPNVCLHEAVCPFGRFLRRCKRADVSRSTSRLRDVKELEFHLRRRASLRRHRWKRLERHPSTLNLGQPRP